MDIHRAQDLIIDIARLVGVIENYGDVRDRYSSDYLILRGKNDR